MKKDEEYDPIDVLGATGLKYQGGKIYEEFLNDLRGEKATRVYKEMSNNDPVIGAVLYAIRTLVRQVQWSIREADDTPESKACAEFVEECLFEDMDETWSDTLSEILSFLTFGFSTHEITYKIRRGPDEEDRRFKSRFRDNGLGHRPKRWGNPRVLPGPTAKLSNALHTSRKDAALSSRRAQGQPRRAQHFEKCIYLILLRQEDYDVRGHRD